MIIHEINQGTPEWLEVRKGKFTASNFSDLFMKETTAGYEKAIYKVVYERLTNETPEFYQNEAMIRGSEMESEARQWFEAKINDFVTEVGFCESDKFQGWVGVSPDGFIGAELLEIKCPLYNTQINNLLNGKLPTAYKWQVQGQLYVTESDKCHFVSYHPKLNKLHIEIGRDEKAIKSLEDKLTESIEKAQSIIEKLGESNAKL